jgi:hypothetical protein
MPRPSSAAIFQRVAGVAGLLEVCRVELVRVHHHDAALGQVGQVDFQGGWVHRHEHVRAVAGSVDVEAGEADLESADAGEGALGRSDLGWYVRDCADVVAEHR